MYHVAGALSREHRSKGCRVGGTPRLRRLSAWSSCSSLYTAMTSYRSRGATGNEMHSIRNVNVHDN